MPTLADVIRRWREVEVDTRLYGAEAEFLKENHSRFRAIGDALRQDGGYPLGRRCGCPTIPSSAKLPRLGSMSGRSSCGAISRTSNSSSAMVASPFVGIALDSSNMES